MPARPRMTCHLCGRTNGVSGEDPKRYEEWHPHPRGTHPAWHGGGIGGTAQGCIAATLKRMAMVGLCQGWCFSCSTDKILSRMEMGFRHKSLQESYMRWRLMKCARTTFGRSIKLGRAPTRRNGSSVNSSGVPRKAGTPGERPANFRRRPGNVRRPTVGSNRDHSHSVVFGFLCLGVRLDIRVDRCHEESRFAFSCSHLPDQPSQRKL